MYLFSINMEWRTPFYAELEKLGITLSIHLKINSRKQQNVSKIGRNAQDRLRTLFRSYNFAK